MRSLALRGALLIGVFIAALGVLGIVAPGTFVDLNRFVTQTPSVVYLVAAIRIVIGVVLIRAALDSRMPRSLRVLGLLIVLGGLLTPFVGLRAAGVILDWWSASGPALVRVWAAVAIAIGAFIVYAAVAGRVRPPTPA